MREIIRNEIDAVFYSLEVDGRTAQFDKLVFEAEMSQWEAAEYHEPVSLSDTTANATLPCPAVDRRACGTMWKKSHPERGQVKEFCRLAQVHYQDLKKWRNNDAKFPDSSETSRRIVKLLNQNL